MKAVGLKFFIQKSSTLGTIDDNEGFQYPVMTLGSKVKYALNHLSLWLLMLTQESVHIWHSGCLSWCADDNLGLGPHILPWGQRSRSNILKMCL